MMFIFLELTLFDTCAAADFNKLVTISNIKNSHLKAMEWRHLKLC